MFSCPHDPVWDQPIARKISNQFSVLNSGQNFEKPSLEIFQWCSNPSRYQCTFLDLAYSRQYYDRAKIACKSDLCLWKGCTGCTEAKQPGSNLWASLAGSWYNWKKSMLPRQDYKLSHSRQERILHSQREVLLQAIQTQSRPNGQICLKDFMCS